MDTKNALTSTGREAKSSARRNFRGLASGPVTGVLANQHPRIRFRRFARSCAPVRKRHGRRRLLHGMVRAGENGRLPRTPVRRIANDSCAAARHLLVRAPSGIAAFIDHVAEAKTGPVEPTPPGPEQIARMQASSGSVGITLLPDSTASA